MISAEEASGNLTQRAPKGRRRIQPAEREPRRRPKGDILHAQREAMQIFVLYRFQDAPKGSLRAILEPSWEIPGWLQLMH